MKELTIGSIVQLTHDDYKEEQKKFNLNEILDGIKSGKYKIKYQSHP